MTEKKKKKKHPVDRVQIMQRFGYLAEVTVDAFVSLTSFQNDGSNEKTWLLKDLFITDGLSRLQIEHMWVKSNLFTEDFLGKFVTYKGTVQAYQKSTGTVSYEIVPKEIIKIEEKPKEMEIV